MSKQAMGYLVAYLERRGYLDRMPDPFDRRAVLVVRTERGWEVSRIARELVQQTQSEWARVVGDEQMAGLLRCLRELVARLGHEFRGSVADPSVLAGHRVPGQRRGGVRT